MATRTILAALAVSTALIAVSGDAPAQQERCPGGNAGLALPTGLCATIFADNLGQARHLAVAPDGTVFVNSWHNPNKPKTAPPKGGWLIALRDTNGDGVAEAPARFGPGPDGGTGIAIHDGRLYAQAGGRIVRYDLAPGRTPAGTPQTIVEGLPMTGDHTMHSIAIAGDGTLYVNSGSATNACQVKNRTLHSPGRDPCDELPTRAGLWTFSANETNQAFAPDKRFATGLRNSVGLAISPAGELFAMQHGRDQLHDNWPEKFTVEQNSVLPAELLVKPKAGEDYGWPYCYYDGPARAYRLAPEYGGDGTQVGRCTGKAEPVAIFPAHWAPNALLFYTGTLLPERYRNGAFIAFHGSWNRVTQEGFNVVFQPMDAGGNPAGKFEIFADGFAGPAKTPTGAEHRPTGLAQGPDGALYVSDDQRGRIYRIAPAK